MISILLLVLGSATIALQEGTAPHGTRETDPGIYTSFRESITDATFQTAFNHPEKSRNRPNCKNQFLCDFQEKSKLSKGFPRVPSKNLVPPFTDAEEEDLKATEVPRTSLNEAETERVVQDTLAARETSVRSVQFPITNQKTAASNELRSYLPPSKITPSEAQVDLSYLPPKGVLPQEAAASLDIARVNYLAPVEVKPAAAQIDATQVEPEHTLKDICSDSFHSFLCTPLKARKRITGALPSEFIRSGLVSPAASNAVQNSVSTAETSYLPPSPPPAKLAPQPSNVDRSYLPPAPPSFSASSSFNSVNLARPNDIAVTERKPFATSTPRPFVQTTIIPFISPKVIEQINFTPATRRPNTATVAPKLFPEPSYEFSREYLPPVGKEPASSSRSSSLSTFDQRLPSVQAITNAPKVTTTPRPTPRPTTIPTTRPTPRPTPRPIPEDRNYLPPSPNFEPAAAVQVNQAVAPATANRIAVPNHDHHDHHHHDRDICTDPFHSFLCAPLKQRKRITGALPPGFNPQSSNRKETSVRPGLTPKPEILKPENTFQSERRIKPTEEVPAANAPDSQTVGYQYPTPSPAFPLPSQTSQTVKPAATTGYQYPKPSNPLPLPSQQKLEVISKEDKAPAAASPQGYQYPKPSPSFPQASQTSQTVKPTATTGYQYPKPSNPLPLPSQQKFDVISKEDKTPAAASPQGYQYPKPSPAFPLPSQTSQTVKPTASTGYQYPKPSNPLPLPSQQKSEVISKEDKAPAAASPQGYQYPKPSPAFPLPSQSSSQTVKPTATTGYQYPKPSNPLPLPTEQKLEVISKEDKAPAAASPEGYQYPKPSPAFPLPSQSSSQTVKPTASTGYQYPKPSNPLPLPSQQTAKVVPQEEKATAAASPQGYQYPKPAVPFVLPSESQQTSPSTTPLPPRTTSQPKPQPSDQSIGYQYAKPAQNSPEPSGYQYPKPQNQLVLPSERKTISDLGSAEFIPVNKIDAKRQVRTGTSGSTLRFGDRIRKS